MSLFCMHTWSPYHATEILYFDPNKRKHIRIFETCQMCRKLRQVDFYPEELEDEKTTEAL